MRASTAMPRIAFVGPIAEPGKSAGGGYAASNRRTIDLIRAEGLRVIEFPYPLTSGSLIHKSAAYGLSFTQIATALIRSRHNWDVLHITPLLRQFLPAESLLCRIPERLGKALFLDLRAGTLIRCYHERGETYRRSLQRLIKKGAAVAVEGRQYADFVRKWATGKILYFPNYVVWRSDFARPDHDGPNQYGELRLITVGRVVPEKGIDIAIGIVAQARKCALRASLEVVGNGDTAYIKRLKSDCRSLPVSFAGPLPPSEIFKRLASSHFFIFPTTHQGEGHSNALTEAMALGVVPICSDNGFNCDVVGGSGAILSKTATATDYLNAIRSIMDNGNWGALSQTASHRVRTHFSHEAVLPSLIQTYLDAHEKMSARQQLKRSAA